MKLKPLLVSLMMWSFSSLSAELDSKFLSALHKTETNRKHGYIIGDKGNARGAFQIHRKYFNDAAQFDKSLGNDYSKVDDFEFSKKVVSAYMNRYAPKSIKTKNYQILARVHNGGPKGYRNPKTLKYWNEFRKYLK